MNLQRIVDSITYIPHLDLGMQFDVARLAQEFGALVPDVFQPYRSTIPQVAEQIARSWHGASLFSPDGSLHGDLYESSTEYVAQCMPTSLTELCPYMVEVVDALGGQDRKLNIGTRARIMIVQPGGSLTWHSHQFDTVEDPRPNVCVVHVPIAVPYDFRYSVISLKDMRLGDHEKEPLKVYTENYPAGSAWLFNSIHYHNVFNDSRVPRVSLMLYLDLNNPKTFAIVDRAVANYTGEWIPR